MNPLTTIALTHYLSRGVATLLDLWNNASPADFGYLAVAVILFCWVIARITDSPA